MDPVTLDDFREEVRTFLKDDPLIGALEHMRGGGFSQVVVREQDKLALLTTEGVAKWLEQQIQEEVINVADAVVEDALAFELPKSFHLMSRRDTLEQAQAAFLSAVERGRERLYAVIITENGKPHETPLGVVTPWDVIEDD